MEYTKNIFDTSFSNIFCECLTLCRHFSVYYILKQPYGKYKNKVKLKTAEVTSREYHNQ